MTSNRNNYLSSQTDSESLRNVNNPVLSSSSDQNRIIGNINSTRRRDPIDTQIIYNSQSNTQNTHNRNQSNNSNQIRTNTTSTRSYNQGQFNTNMDYIGSVIANSLQEIANDDSIFEEIENDRTNRGLMRANSNSTNFNTNANSYNYGLTNMIGYGMNQNQTPSTTNMTSNQQIRYAPAYEYLPRLGGLSDIIPINSQTGRFYLGRDRNMNILRGRITLGDDGGIIVSLSDINRGGETIQSFASKRKVIKIDV